MSLEETEVIKLLKQFKETADEGLGANLSKILMSLPPGKVQELYAQAGMKSEGSVMQQSSEAGLREASRPSEENRQKNAAQVTPTSTPQTPASTPESKPAGPQPLPAAPPAAGSSDAPPRPTVKAVAATAAATAATVAVKAGAIAASAAVPPLAPVIKVAEVVVEPVAQQMARSGAQAIVGAAAATAKRQADAWGAPVNPRSASMAAQGRANTSSREFTTNIVQPLSKVNVSPDAPMVHQQPAETQPVAKLPEPKPASTAEPTPAAAPKGTTTPSPFSTTPKPKE